MLKPVIILLLSYIFCQQEQLEKPQQGHQYPSFPLNGTVTITGEAYLNVAPDTFAVAFLIQKTGDTPSSSLQNLIDSSKDLIKNLTSDNSINVTEIEQSIVSLHYIWVIFIDQHSKELLQNGFHVHPGTYYQNQKRRQQKHYSFKSLSSANRAKRPPSPIRNFY